MIKTGKRLITLPTNVIAVSWDEIVYMTNPKIMFQSEPSSELEIDLGMI